MHRQKNIELQEWVQEWLPLLAVQSEVKKYPFENNEQRSKHWKEQFIALGCKSEMIDNLFRLFEINHKQIACQKLYCSLLQINETERTKLTDEDFLFLSGEREAVKYSLNQKKVVTKAEKEKYLMFAMLTEDVFVLKALIQKTSSLSESETTSAKEIDDFMQAYIELKKTVAQYTQETILSALGNIVCFQLRETASKVLASESYIHYIRSQSKTLCDCTKSVTAVLENPYDLNAIKHLREMAQKKASGNPEEPGEIVIFRTSLLATVGFGLALSGLGGFCLAFALGYYLLALPIFFGGIGVGVSMMMGSSTEERLPRNKAQGLSATLFQTAGELTNKVDSVKTALGSKKSKGQKKE